MKKLIDIFEERGYNVDYPDAKETLNDNEALLKTGYIEAARKNLRKFWLGEFTKESYEIDQIIDLYVKGL